MERYGRFDAGSTPAVGTMTKAEQKAAYKAEGLRRMKERKARRRLRFKEKREMNTRLSNWQSCCEYGMPGQQYCDGSC